MARVQDGHTQTFSRLVEPHFDRLFRLAYRLTGSRSDAEDLLQDVLTRLFEQRHKLEQIKDLKPWLTRVLYNRFVDGTRSARRRPLTLVGDTAEVEKIAPSAEAADRADPALQNETARRAARLEKALNQLNKDQRTLVLMHDAEGYTLPEIASLTDTPTGTLKSRLSRARAKLRELLWDLQEKKKMEPFSSQRRVAE